jgi:single-strand DNA-binding protein
VRRIVMAGYNRIIMVGNLTKDPDLKPVGNQSVCKLNIASNKQYKNRQTGALISEVCFIDIEVWGVQAESCNNYLQKGRPILVEGRLKLDSWKDNDGNTRSKHSIVADKVVFLGTATEQQDEDTDDTNQSLNKQTIQMRQPKDKYRKTATPDAASFVEDDLPF